MRSKIEESCRILGLDSTYSFSQLVSAYVRVCALKDEIPGRYKNAFYILYEHIINLTTNQGIIKEIMSQTKSISQMSEESSSERSMLNARLRNFLLIYDIENGLEEPEQRLNIIKENLRNAPFDYENYPKETLRLWELYSAYKDGSSIIKSK